MTPSAPIPPMICEKSTMSPSPVVPHHRERLQRQPRGSITTASCRRANLLPKEDSYSMKDKNEKSSGDFSRHHDSSFINAFGDKITAAIAEKAEKRVRTGMGLREQEQHMVKLGRENWALKIDVTLLKKKRDELGSMNEQLTHQVEALSRENRELKRELKRTQAVLDCRERELDEACRIYEKLGQTKAVLEVLTKTQRTQQPGGYDRHGADSPVWGSRPGSPSSVRSTRRVAPKSTEREKGRGLPVLSSPSVSTCCSLRHIPRHISTDDEDGDSSEDDSPTPPRTVGGWESEKGSCGSHIEEIEIKSHSSLSQVSAEITPPSSTTSVHTKKGTCQKRILKFNRCEEPDSSDYSSDEEDMFDSDCYGSTASSPNTLTPMTSSPEPNRAYVSGHESNPERMRKLPPLAVPNRASYTGSIELAPIDETPGILNTPNTYRNSMFCNGLGLIEPFDCSASVTDSLFYSNTNTTSYPCRIPIPSTTKSTVQRNRRHLDSTSRMMTAREVLTKKLLKV